MASIIVRNLDEQLKARLRMEAARHGHSMEEEVRIILRNALSLQQTKGLGTRIHERFADSGGLEIEMPARSDKPQDAGFEA